MPSHSDKRNDIKASIRSALTLPQAVLQMLADGKRPPKSAINEALLCFEEIVKDLKRL